jgi:hypothetical protein
MYTLAQGNLEVSVYCDSLSPGVELFAPPPSSLSVGEPRSPSIRHTDSIGSVCVPLSWSAQLIVAIHSACQRLLSDQWRCYPRTGSEYRFAQPHARVPGCSPPASYNVSGKAHTVLRWWEAVRVIAYVRCKEAPHMFCDRNHKIPPCLPVVSISDDGKPLAVIGHECGEVSRIRCGGANGTSRDIHESEHVTIAVDEGVFQKRVPQHRTCSYFPQEDHIFRII